MRKPNKYKVAKYQQWCTENNVVELVIEFGQVLELISNLSEAISNLQPGQSHVVVSLMTSKDLKQSATIPGILVRRTMLIMDISPCYSPSDDDMEELLKYKSVVDNLLKDL